MIKKFLPRTLFGRSLLILVTPILLIQVITTAVFFDRHWTKMTSRLSYAVAGEIAIMAKSIEADPDSEKLKRIVEYTQQHLGLKVGFKKDTALPDRAPLPSGELWKGVVADVLEQELQNQLEQPFVIRLDTNAKTIQVFVKLRNGVLDVVFPQRRLYSSSGYIFLLWMLCISLLLLVVAVMFMRNQIRPIRRLAVAAERFGKGRDVPSFRPQGAREVRQAAEAFIDMHRRIRRQVEQRTAMLAGVSHDLRTPLTRLKLQLEMLGDSPDAADMKADIADMEKMIAGYLDFVRGEGDEQPAYTNLNDVLERVADSGRRQGLDVEMDFDGTVQMILKPLAFERALNNIISNARKHAGKIWISGFVEDDKKVQVTIDDNGPGMDEAEFEEVFKPFYRVDSSRNAATGGVGLGLPIALDIIQSHGGNVYLQKSPHGGVRAVIRLPL